MTTFTARFYACDKKVEKFPERINLQLYNESK